MTGRSDDEDVNPLRRRLDDRAAEALLAGREVTGEPELSALMGEMRSLADVPVPEPSAALAAMLTDGFEVSPVAQAVSWRKRAWALPLQLSLGSALAVGLVLGAAAGNELPATMQTAVADAVEAVTPLHVPRPAQDRPARVTPSPRTTDDSTVKVRPSAAPTPGAGNPERGRSEDRPRPSAKPGGNDHRSPGPSRPSDRPGNEDRREPRTDNSGSAPATPATPAPPNRDPRNGQG